MRSRLRGWLTDTGAVAGEAADDIVLAVSEAAANAVEYAYRGGGGGGGEVGVQARVGGDGAVELSVRDAGRWRDGRRAPPDGGRGRGLVMVRSIMDEVTIDAGAEGTVVRMRRASRRPAETGAGRRSGLSA